jgi:cell wall-associated protease
MKKIILSLSLLICVSLSAQTYPKDWHLNYSVKDTALGIDLFNALKNFPQPATAKEIIVAVIDDGIDIEHEDLKQNIWVNPKEIPGNSVDDDLNGYVDDINGWDFIGGTQMDVEIDNLEMTRLVRDYRIKYGTKTKKDIIKADRADFARFKKLEAELAKKLEEAGKNFNTYKTIKQFFDALEQELETTDITAKDLEKFNPSKNEAKIARKIILDQCIGGKSTPKKVFDDIKEAHKHFYALYKYQLNTEYDPRYMVGDVYEDTKNRFYGNNEVKGPNGDHGTHVGGIIGAVRDNNIGMQGIAPLVKIMVLRVVPDGDERDKDVANAVRYAVDNGAKVINMSFGKAYSYNKTYVDEAFKYAESKDVLIIHAAGNDGKNTDKESNFPTPFYEDGSLCKTWIEVGASDRDQNPADFSNYGKKTVNVFAPGVNIYSTVINNEYKAFSGTSMASPVTAGLAALIRAYYPHLTAVQVKQVIEGSVVKPTQKVKKPGSKKKKTKYKKLCTTAGIINANEALKAAAAIK